MTEFERAAFATLKEAVKELAGKRKKLGWENMPHNQYAKLSLIASTLLLQIEDFEDMEKKAKEVKVEDTKDSIVFIHEVVATEYAATKSDDAYKAMRLIEMFAEEKYEMELLPPVETE